MKLSLLLNGENWSWTNVCVGVLQGSIVSPLLFVNTSVKEVNSELEKVSDWTFQWKMSFNPDPSTQGQQILFSRILKKLVHAFLILSCTIKLLIVCIMKNSNMSA